MDKETIGKLIKARRMEKGLSQKQLAELIQVSLATVSKWETGVNLPDILILDKIAKGLDIPLAELLDTGASAANGESASGNREPCNETELCNEADSAASPPIPAVSDASALQSESLAGDALPGNQPRLKVRWPKWHAFVLGFILIAIAAAIAIGGYLMLDNKDGVFSVEICEEYEGDYEGESAYYIIIEYSGEPTAEELMVYNEDNIRRQYERQFFSFDLIIVIYTEDYVHYKEHGYDEAVDRESILYP